MNKNIQKRKLSKDLKRDWQLYLFLFIPLVYTLIFSYLPMGGLLMAFQNYKPRLGFFNSEWVGLYQFKKFFASYQSWRIIKNTLILSVYDIIAGFPIPIIFALLVNSLPRERFKKISQTIVNLPHFISVTVMVGILFQFLNSRTGLYGMVGQLLTNNYPSDLFSKPQNFLHIYVWSGIWQNFGWGSIIYIAGLSSVDLSYHEAARVDGATRFQRVINIDFPAILPTIVVMLILRTGSLMSVGYEKIFLLQNTLNKSTSEVISTYVYNVGLSSAGVVDFSYATAIGFFNSLINLVIITGVNFAAKKIRNESLW